jgi:hypothetical protein
MDRRRNVKHSLKRMSPSEIRKFDYKKTKRAVDDIMNALDTYKLEFSELDFIIISSSSIIKFNPCTFNNNTSVEEKYLSKKSFNLAKIFLDKLEYLTSTILSNDERDYLLNVYYDHLNTECIMETLSNSGKKLNSIRNSTIIKTGLFFHCAVRRDDND